MIILLITLALAQEPEFTEDNSPDLNNQEIEFIDNLDKELLDEAVKDIPKIRLDGCQIAACV